VDRHLSSLVSRAEQLAREQRPVDFCGEQILLADLEREGYIICEIRLIWTVGVGIIRIVWIRIWKSEPNGKSEADKHRIRPKKAVIGKEAAINEEPVIREEVAVKIIESAVEKSTTNETWTVKLLKSAALKTHITALKTSRTTAMKAPTTTKTSVTNTDRRHRE
jgi:hypothetical protein